MLTFSPQDAQVLFQKQSCVRNVITKNPCVMCMVCERKCGGGEGGMIRKESSYFYSTHINMKTLN